MIAFVAGMLVQIARKRLELHTWTGWLAGALFRAPTG